MSSKYKEHKSLIQAWLINDKDRNSRQAYAVEIWEHFKEQNNGLTSDTMTEALIAYNEKVGNGFQPVPDESPQVIKAMRQAILKIEHIAHKLSSLDLSSANFNKDFQEMSQEMSQAVETIHLNIVSDSMSFEDEDDAF